MTQTPGPPATGEQQSTTPDGPAPSLDRARLPGLEHLRRSTTDRKIAGVAGGLGRHLDIDPVILRVLFVVMCFFGGSGFLLYGAAWLLVPEDGRLDGKIAMRPSTRNALLVGAGVIATLLLLGDGWGGIGFPWPLLIVGIAVLVYLGVRDRGPAPVRQHPAPSYGPPGAPAPGTTAYDPTVPPPWLPQEPAAPAYPPPRPKRGPLLFGPTLALVAVALGLLGLYDASGGEVVDSAYPALALAVVGLMLVVGAFVGRAGGLVLLGILAAGALAVTSLVGALGGVGDGDGERLNATPPTASAVLDSYFVPNGRIVVDLSEVRDPAALAGRSIDIGARAGELVVILPVGVVTHVDAEVTGPGQVDVPGHSAGGFGNSVTETLGSGTGSLSLRAHLFAGHIDVRTS